MHSAIMMIHYMHAARVQHTSKLQGHSSCTVHEPVPARKPILWRGRRLPTALTACAAHKPQARAQISSTPPSHERVAGARTATSATPTRLGRRPRSLSPAGRATGRGPRCLAVDLPGTHEDCGWVGGRGRWQRLNWALHCMRGERLPRCPQLRRVRGHQAVAVQHAVREGRA